MNWINQASQFLPPVELIRSALGIFIVGGAIALSTSFKSLPEPRSAEDYYRRAVERFARADDAGALLDYNHALKLSPRSAKIYLGRGNLLSAIGKQRLASADYRTARSLFIAQGDHTSAMAISEK